MLQYVVVLAFATFTGWCFVRYISPGAINERLAFFCVVLLAFGFTFVYPYQHRPSLFLALAATGIVAGINKIIDARIDPLEINFKKFLPKRVRPKPTSKRTGHRIPML